MNTRVTIYVRLPEESIDVWRPVEAESLGDDRYSIIDNSHLNDAEHWEFEPGSTVKCSVKIWGGERLLVAHARAED